MTVPLLLEFCEPTRDVLAPPNNPPIEIVPPLVRFWIEPEFTPASKTASGLPAPSTVKRILLLLDSAIVPAKPLLLPFWRLKVLAALATMNVPAPVSCPLIVPLLGIQIVVVVPAIPLTAWLNIGLP